MMQVTRKGSIEKKAEGMLTTLAGLAIVLLAVVNLISQLFQSVRSIFAL